MGLEASAHLRELWTKSIHVSCMHASEGARGLAKIPLGRGLLASLSGDKNRIYHARVLWRSSPGPPPAASTTSLMSPRRALGPIWPFGPTSRRDPFLPQFQLFFSPKQFQLFRHGSKDPGFSRSKSACPCAISVIARGASSTASACGAGVAVPIHHGISMGHGHPQNATTNVHHVPNGIGFGRIQVGRASKSPRKSWRATGPVPARPVHSRRAQEHHESREIHAQSTSGGITC